jgi:Flp pilus assembly protein TadD
MYRALIVAVLIAAVPSVAYPCGNEVMLTGDEAVKLLAKAETFLERGKYRAALGTLDGFAFDSPQLEARATDIQAVFAVRMKTRRSNVQWVVQHFKARSEARPKDMRLRARLAEAYEAAGKDDLAREILVDLNSRDLMPDAFAYRTLARVSSGDDRQAALTACGIKAKNKSICTILADKSPTRPTI